MSIKKNKRIKIESVTRDTKDKRNINELMPEKRCKVICGEYQVDYKVVTDARELC